MISRKGAETQSFLVGLAAFGPPYIYLFFLCAFAPLREIIVFGFEIGVVMVTKKRQFGEKAVMNHRTPKKLPELWQLLIECKNEKDQERLYHELEKRGYSCRVLTL
jgi:hypothetical protein